MGKVIGIDLGTTNSLVTTVKSGSAVCIADEQGRVLLPSVVRYCESGRIETGYDALRAQKVDPINTGTGVPVLRAVPVGMFSASSVQVRP